MKNTNLRKSIGIPLAFHTHTHTHRNLIVMKSAIPEEKPIQEKVFFEMVSI